jgi:hypothetical protein
MEWLSRAEIGLLLIAGYVAVMTLVRMMQRRHDALVADVKRQVDAHRQHPKRPKAPESKSSNQTRGAA